MSLFTSTPGTGWREEPEDLLEMALLGRTGAGGVIALAMIALEGGCTSLIMPYDTLEVFGRADDFFVPTRPSDV